MKHFKCLFKCLVLVFFLLLTNNSQAQNDTIRDPQKDSLRVSLLTCGPGKEVYSLYGHTAIRITNATTGSDLVANYGLFSLDKSFFVPLFVFGITDYSMGLTYFEWFRESYADEGRWIKEQELNLSQEDKLNIVRALEENYLPENRVYRYNYFYDNCTTRARDILVNNINGNVAYPTHQSSKVTYRKLIHAHTEGHPWARFGNDLLLGVKADLPIDSKAQQFLPNNLMNDFEEATISNDEGSNRSLIQQTFWIIPPTPTNHSSNNIFTPFAAALTLCLLILLVTVWERYKHKNYWIFDIILLTADGIAGLILLCMVFSQHPTVQINLQILLLCPINLFLIVPTIRQLRKGQVNKWLKIWCVMLVLFIFGRFIQHYACGTVLLALCLLIRYGGKILNKSSLKTKTENSSTKALN